MWQRRLMVRLAGVCVGVAMTGLWAIVTGISRINGGPAAFVVLLLIVVPVLTAAFWGERQRGWRGLVGGVMVGLLAGFLLVGIFPYQIVTLIRRF